MWSYCDVKGNYLQNKFIVTSEKHISWNSVMILFCEKIIFMRGNVCKPNLSLKVFWKTKYAQSQICEYLISCDWICRIFEAIFPLLLHYLTNFHTIETYCIYKTVYMGQFVQFTKQERNNRLLFYKHEEEEI
jgi:hypothetical protein